ncbi:structure-specific recognition protein [Kipferlia bialata]|uniref:FACT complex subunit SSRP1 n=1 Tax=Kipferlia bialata TaxID=797122 RepID=A0A9K3CUU3_9EUKA|nr:structure-specific recognition protein [Kipferlia bialata]|eukprot:g3682.t1
MLGALVVLILLSGGMCMTHDGMEVQEFRDRKELTLDVSLEGVKKGDIALRCIRFGAPPEQINDLHENLMERAQLNAEDRAYCEFKEIKLKRPRANYDIEFHKDFIVFRGKSVQFRVRYGAVSRVCLVEHPNQDRYVMDIGLTSSVALGKTRYDHLLLELTKDTIELDLNMPEEERETRFGRTELEGEAWEVFARVMKTFTSHRPVVPEHMLGKEGAFESASGMQSVKCMLGNEEGMLFPMPRALLFLYHPTLYLEYRSMARAEFQTRSGRTVQLTVSMRTDRLRHVFHNIDLSERDGLIQELKRKGVTVTEAQAPQQQSTVKQTLDHLQGYESDEEDDDFDIQEAEHETDEDDDDEDGASEDGAQGMDVSDVEDESPEEDGKPKKEKKAKAPRKRTKKAKPVLTRADVDMDISEGDMEVPDISTDDEPEAPASEVLDTLGTKRAKPSV